MALLAGVDHSAASEPSNGETKIADWHDLNAVREDLDGEYVLVTDLDEETAGYDEYVGDPEQGWEPIGDSGPDATPFTGTFDGNGYEIRDLKSDRQQRDVGIFGVHAGTITNLTVTDAEVAGLRSVGGLVGRNDGGDVVESSVREADISGRTAGCLVGSNRDGAVIESAVSEAEVTSERLTANARAGGLAGSAGAAVSSSLSGGPDSRVGGLVGSNSGEVIASSVAEADITGDEWMGGLVGNNRGEVRNSHYNLDSVRINGEQQLTLGGIFEEQYDDWRTNDRELEIRKYDSLSEVDGWIELTDAHAVRDALGFVGDSSVNWRLQRDLDLTGDDAGLYFPHLAGTLDGNGHTITVDLDLPVVVGVGVVGYNSGTIDSVAVDGTITGGRWVGGLVGRNSGEILSSVSEADVTGEEMVGGLVGLSGSELSSPSTGEITAEVVESSVTEAKITGDRWVGGLVGSNSGEVMGSSVTEAEITGDRDIGGLVGSSSGEVAESSVSETAVTGHSPVGGLVGTNREGGVVGSSVSATEITGTDLVGGLSGSNDGEIGESRAVADVTGDRGVGGLVGRNSDEVMESSVSDAEITGNERVGGLVGSNSGVVSESMSAADISGEQDVGGLVGRSSGEVVVSWAAGEVTGDRRVGGLIGDNHHEAEIAESWAAGEVTGEELVGGLTGRNLGTHTAGYWDTESTGQSEGVGTHSGDVTGLTTDEMHGETAPANMDALDFEGTWQAVTDPDYYPLLQWQDRDQLLGGETQTDDNGDNDGGDGADDAGPGFGIPGAVAGVGGGAYLLHRRLSNSDSDSE